MGSGAEISGLDGRRGPSDPHPDLFQTVAWGYLTYKSKLVEMKKKKKKSEDREDRNVKSKIPIRNITFIQLII